MPSQNPHAKTKKHKLKKTNATSNTQSSTLSLIEQMKHESAHKPQTSRFTIDLDPERKHKLEILAAHTTRSKASVIKFLIDAAYAQLETDNP
jgi:hypothetical protein